MRYVVLLALFVSGCATEGKFRERLDSWVGHDINEMITQSGPPDSTYDMPNGAKIYTWMNGGGYRSMASYNPYTHQVMSFGGAIYCKVSYSVNPMDSKITSYRYEGNACKAK